MAKIKPTTTEKQVSLRIDLVEFFGMPVKSEGIRQLIADDLIQKIQDRTLSGYGVKNGERTRLKRLTKKYADKVGKPLTPVNLELSGDMLNSITLIDSTRNWIEIGINDEKQAPKAHGHQTGQHGKGPLPVRPFMGLLETDVSKLASKYRKEIEKAGYKKASEFLDQQAENVSSVGISRQDILDALASLNKISVEGS